MELLISELLNTLVYLQNTFVAYHLEHILRQVMRHKCQTTEHVS